MRTTLDIDEKLLRDAARLSSGKSKKAVVEEALREFTRKRRIEQLRKMAGTDAIDLDVEDLRRMRGK